MKHYSYLQSISYDIIILISYSKGKGSKLSIFKGLVLWSLGFKMRKIFIISHVIRK